MPVSSSIGATRAGLSLQKIATVAVAIADREGLRAVSMRRLARELSVTPMALYWHLSDKDALLDAMAEHVVADARFADEPDGAWQDRYRSVLSTLVTLLHAHPWMGRLLIERLVPRPNYLTALEIMLDSIRVAGLSPEVGATLAQQSVQTVVALAEYEPQSSKDPLKAATEGAALEASLDDLDPMEFPNIRVAATSLTKPPSRDEYYRLGIETIIGGIRSITDTAANSP
jgi:AcrR family transcriptional regulator